MLRLALRRSDTRLRGRSPTAPTHRPARAAHLGHSTKSDGGLWLPRMAYHLVHSTSRAGLRYGDATYVPSHSPSSPNPGSAHALGLARAVYLSRSTRCDEGTAYPTPSTMIGQRSATK